MSAYQIVTPGVIGQPSVSATNTSQLFPLGFIADAVDPTYGAGQFMYVRGASASAPTAGDVCILTGFSAGQAVSGNTASQGAVGVAPAALSNTNVYGWVQVQGVCDFAKLATAGTGAVGVGLCIGTTAGRAQTTAGATGYRIDNAWISQYTTTANSNSGIVNLAWPSYNGTTPR